MLNVAIIHGRLTADPELQTTKNGKKTVNFRVAVNGNGKDAQTDFIPVVAWEKLAENICKNLKKGSEIIVNARLDQREYKDKNDVNHFVVELVAEYVDFCGKKAEKSVAKEAPAAEAPADDDELPDYP